MCTFLFSSTYKICAAKAIALFNLIDRNIFSISKLQSLDSESSFVTHKLSNKFNVSLFL